MPKDSEDSKLELAEFLRLHNFTDEQFGSTELPWDTLRQICAHHQCANEELQTTAGFITERLQSVGAVHSLKVRIKASDHLIAKIVRKKLKDVTLSFDIETYDAQITDLIGVRALHLFKDEWRQIHEFVMGEWELHETPKAYYRDGDHPSVLDAFKAAGLDIQEHEFGYRSVHYIIKSQPTKRLRLAELQVRTIFEEGWSEIDHRVRYPRQSDDPLLATFLTTFNRHAGSADEMGSFVKDLGVSLHAQRSREAAARKDLARQEEELKKTISQLRITQDEKTKLEKQVTELSKAPLDLNYTLGLNYTPGLLGSLALRNVLAGEKSSWEQYRNAAFGSAAHAAGLVSNVCSRCGGVAERASALSQIAGIPPLCAKCASPKLW